MICKGIVRPELQVFRNGGTLAGKSTLLWVGQGPIPDNVQQAATEIGELRPYSPDESLGSQLGDTAVALVCAEGHDEQYVDGVLNELASSGTVGLVLLPKESPVAEKLESDHQGQCICADRNSDPQQLAVQLATAVAIQPSINRLQSDLASARSFSAEASQAIEELDEEMRLAARLQRDFLPRRLPEVGPARFGVLYHPAGWVSGDIYDVVRLDETHVGFYVADVVGHGMPAALLTMFIKKAMQTKRILGSNYQILPPHVSLRELNASLCEQDLPSCQFCTAVYCVLDTASLVLTHSRGGHPEPVVLHDDGQIERLWVDGSLLGVFPDEDYSSATYQLRPGDRLLVYTDGAEEVIRQEPGGQAAPIEACLHRWANLTRQEMLLQMAAGLESQQRPPKDDVTLLVLDVET